MGGFPYSQQELFTTETRVLPDDAGAVAFLLGGIGTGNVSVGARGQFTDWEIFNSPGKGDHLPYTFFALWIKPEGEPGVARVLEAELHPPYTGPHGFAPYTVAGLPRLASSTMRGEYPFVWIEFHDDSVPVKVRLEAFTPFIPLNAAESGIPGAIIRYALTNTSRKMVEVSVAGSVANIIGYEGYTPDGNIRLKTAVHNRYREVGTCKGLFLSAELPENDLKYGNMSLLCTAVDVTYKAEWLEGGWTDGIQDFWDDFRSDGRLEKRSSFQAPGNEWGKLNAKVGSLAIHQRIAPGETKTFEFVLSWYFPNRLQGWTRQQCSCDDYGAPRIVRNYYSTLFTDAWHVGHYLVDNLARLEQCSRDFHRALFGSTLPSYVIDALASNITVLRSPTCFRLADGTFLSWEGCHDGEGCCEGNCTHVWNYAQTVAFLFPELERSMRRVEFGLETGDDGRMAFRTRQVFGLKKWDMLPAVDGQLGTVIRLYRDWKLCGDDRFLADLWPKASKALDFAFTYWDADGDFVLEAQQHTTYDIELYGPNSLSGTMFLAALKAGALMAAHLGDVEHELKYLEALEKGSKKLDELLWNGEYYCQKLDDVNRYRYQYGIGCLSDQLFGQMLAHVAGLGYVLPENHVKTALKSIYKYNFLSEFRGHHNVQRVYALGDEKGLVLCSWPKGGRPRLPFVYSDEVWTGVEYQVAAHLIYAGLVEEGLTIVKAVRDRHDGYRRNPWNEVECGHHYVRSMASWALLLALSGFKYDMTAGTISFSPAINADDFSTFWSTSRAWGIYRQRREADGRLRRELEVLYGDPDGVRLG